MKRLWILAIVILVGMASMMPMQTALADGHEAVTHSPCDWLDLNYDDTIDITDVSMVVEGYGTLYYLTDIGRVVSQFGQYGLVCL